MSTKLTEAERATIREGLPHMACPKPGELGACGCPDVYEAVERIIAARLAAERERIAGEIEACGKEWVENQDQRRSFARGVTAAYINAVMIARRNPKVTR